MPHSIAPDESRGLSSLGFLPARAVTGYVLAIVAIMLIAWFSYASLVNRTVTSARVQHSIDTMAAIDETLSLVKDAETGQRGYLLGGEAGYLEPYADAKAGLAGASRRLRALVAGDATEEAHVDAWLQLVDGKLAELEQTVDLRRRGDGSAALQIFASEKGRVLMERLRALAAELKAEEQRRQDGYRDDWQQASDRSVWVALGGSAILFVLVLIAAYLSSRDYRARETDTWLRRGQAGLTERLLGEQGLQSLGENALGFISRYLEAPVGTAYVQVGGGRFEQVAAQAPDGGVAAAELRLGEGLVGQAVKDRRLLHLRDLPAGYLPLRSGLGRGDVGELLILPAIDGGVVQAVLEFGFLRPVREAEKELLRRAGDSFALAVRTAKDRLRVQELLEETQQQAEELQTQQEELRVSNEELEEQSSALRASRAQLENQQSELEQSNVQLQELAQQLEHQRDQLARSQVSLIDKAAELERTNTYKSEFLANMSHELRTPLNSTLILAKLLADNKQGNLTEEQVKFAQTIASAGQDLLAIINDILDLAKIEAGKVELNREKVNIAAAADALMRVFRPVADEKGLRLHGEIEPGTPAELVTDPLRLGQILRNLLSNAIKFTEFGEVRLRVGADERGQLQFAVHDTGIGISEAQLESVFEAFRQADGSTHRKYGGTGLGLAISRDLARLLGGDIAVRSTPGRGSVFVLTLPLQPDDAAAGAPPPAPALAPSGTGAAPRAAAPRSATASSPPRPAIAE
ncbi:CHASE3 domain-containing protein, partial [Tahibacter caeni]|uniref:CHASE3 domain-containing protein n=1 Tax=Tahibacter caeni TaxID=1453545 RepID=UPI002147F1F6